MHFKFQARLAIQISYRVSRGEEAKINEVKYVSFDEITARGFILLTLFGNY